MPIVDPIQHRFDPEQLIVFSIAMGPGAGPVPLLRFITESGDHRVSLYMADGCHEIEFIHGKRMKPLLPEVPTPTFSIGGRLE